MLWVAGGSATTLEELDALYRRHRYDGHLARQQPMDRRQRAVRNVRHIDHQERVLRRAAADGNDHHTRSTCSTAPSARGCAGSGRWCAVGAANTDDHRSRRVSEQPNHGPQLHGPIDAQFGGRHNCRTNARFHRIELDGRWRVGRGVSGSWWRARIWGREGGVVDRTQRPIVPQTHANEVEHRRMLAVRANASLPKDGSEGMSGAVPHAVIYGSDDCRLRPLSRRYGLCLR